MYLQRLPKASSGARQVGNLRSIGIPYVGEGKLRPFLKTLCKKSWGIAHSEQKPAKNIDRAANRSLSFERTPT